MSSPPLAPTFLFVRRYLVNHGRQRTEYNARGWYDDELTKQTRDWKEGFDVGHVPAPDLPPDHPTNVVVEGYNQWPGAIPEFKVRRMCRRGLVRSSVPRPSSGPPSVPTLPWHHSFKYRDGHRRNSSIDIFGISSTLCLCSIDTGSMHISTINMLAGGPRGRLQRLLRGFASASRG